MNFKRIISLILALAMTFMFVASCGKDNSSGSESDKGSDVVKTNAPANVGVDANGLVTWDAIDNVNVYIVEVDGGEGKWVKTNSYQLEDISTSHTIVVSANVYGSNGSAHTTDKSAAISYVPYKEPFDESKVKIAIECPVTEIKSGSDTKNSATFTATVTGGEEGFDNGVEWTVLSGEEYVKEQSAVGNKFTIVAVDDVKGDKDIVVAATSVAYPNVVARKSVAVVSKPTLTQDMLDAAGAANKLSFEGYVQLDVYDIQSGGKGKLNTTQTSTVKTAMSNDKDTDPKTRNTWYAEYLNGSTGTNQQIYCRKDENGYACEIGVSLMNEEQLYPMKNDDGSYMTWEESGFYNNFTGLSKDDFYLNEDTWRWAYKTSEKGTDKVKKMIASANPYDFDPLSLELIIDDDEIIGITAVAKDSFSVVEGYITVQTLRTVFNTDDSVKVQTIGKFPTLEELKNNEEYTEFYNGILKLDEAVKNMRGLSSYKVEFTNNQITNLGMTSNLREGYDETVVENYRLFNLCDISTVNNEVVRDYKKNGSYGFKKVKGEDGKYRDDIYNSFYQDEQKDGISEVSYSPTRAYTDGFDSSKASFMFSPEIFDSFGRSDDGNTYYFYAAQTMCSVATTLFKDLGNNTALYGIFASVVQDTSGTIITPTLIVEEIDGKYYITGAYFYYDMGVTTGLVEIEYSDFDSATIDGETIEAIDNAKTRELPESWDEVNITISASGTIPEQNISAQEFMFDGYTAADGSEQKPYFGDKLFAVRDAELPFFGDKSCFGDTYALGMATYFWMTDSSTGTKTQQNALCFYYDVPLDIDYTITSSLEAARAFLVANGFELTYSDIYKKGNLRVRPVDSSLDLFVYVWTEEQLDTPENVKLTGNKLTWDKVENATGYSVYIDGVEVKKGLSKTEYDITETYSDGEEHIVTVVATAKGYVSSPKSDSVIYKSEKPKEN